MKRTACLAVILSLAPAALAAAPTDAQAPREPAGAKKIEAYVAHQEAQGLAIAIDPCFSDAQANGVFEYKNLLSRGILPVLAVIENRGQHTVRIEGQTIYLITSNREFPSLEPLDIRTVLGRLKQGGKKKGISLPVPIPKSTNQLAGLDPKMDQLRARVFEMKLIPAGQRDYGYLYYDLSDPTVLQHLESAYLPEVVDVETGEKLVYFEISLKEAVNGAIRERAKEKQPSTRPAAFSFAGRGFSYAELQQALQQQSPQPPPAAQSPMPEPPQSSPVAPILVPKKSEIVIGLLSLVSTRTAAVGDKFYGQVAVPVITEDRIVIPVGSFIVGSVRTVKRAGRMKGDAELALDFHSVIFPAGETRSIEARVRTADGYRSDEIQKSEGTIQGMPEKGKQLEAGARNATMGAVLGSIVVGGSSQSWNGVSYGGIAGAAAGFGLTLFQRGPDVELPKGAQMTLTLDQDVLLTKK